MNIESGSSMQYLAAICSKTHNEIDYIPKGSVVKADKGDCVFYVEEDGKNFKFYYQGYHTYMPWGSKAMANLITKDGQTVCTESIIVLPFRFYKKILDYRRTNGYITIRLLNALYAYINIANGGIKIDTQKILFDKPEDLDIGIKEMEEKQGNQEEEIEKRQERRGDRKEEVIKTGDILTEFLTIIPEDNSNKDSLTLEQYQAILLIDNKWHPSGIEDSFDTILIANSTDSREIQSEKNRIRNLIKVKNDIDKLKEESNRSIRSSEDEVYYDFDIETDLNTVDTSDKSLEDKLKDAELIRVKNPDLSSTSDEELNDFLEAVNLDTVIDEPKIEGDPHCSICHGKGVYENNTLGIKTICNCVAKYKQKKEVEQARKERLEKNGPLKVQATLAEQLSARSLNLIPEIREGDIFELNTLTKRVKALCAEHNIGVQGDSYKNYLKTLSNINSVLGSGQNLKYSYIISAPNGFSKTTFANSCIANLNGKGKKMVPYKSLYEIANLLVTETSNYSYLRQRKFDKITHKKENEYDWKDYIDAYLVFCFLTVPEYAEIELSTLKSLLSIRGTRGLATIVFAERPISAYNTKQDVGLFLMSDMFTNYVDSARLDRPLKIEVVRGFRTKMACQAGEDL